MTKILLWNAGSGKTERVELYILTNGTDEKKRSDQIQLFENQKIRTAWGSEQEEWYFSVVDVVGALTDQSTPRGAST